MLVNTEILERYRQENTKLVLGFSGGRDSTALLHYLVKAQFPVVPVYINHAVPNNEHKWFHLQDQPHWQEFCKSFCKQLGVVLCEEKMDTTQFGKNNWEDSARKARHAAFKKYEAPVILAHHYNDQLESLILRMSRGSAVEGAYLRSVNVVDEITFLRPLLDTSREEIKQYMLKHQLCHVEDYSNQDTSFKRNFLRHNVVPMLDQQFNRKGFVKTIENLQEAAELTNTLAEIDLDSVSFASSEYLSCWNLNKANTLSNARIKNFTKLFFRRWHQPFTCGILQEVLKRVRTQKSGVIKVGKFHMEFYSDYSSSYVGFNLESK